MAMSYSPQNCAGPQAGAAAPVAQMKRHFLVAFGLGMAMTITLVAWQGLETVAAVLASGGLALALLGPYQFLPILLAALSWRQLLPKSQDQGLASLTAVTWIGLSVNWLLPVAQVGGDLLRARLLTLFGADAAAVGASVVVDKTLQAVAQAGFCLLGVGLLIALVGDYELAFWAGGFVLILSTSLFIFYRLQRGAPASRVLAFLGKVAPTSKLAKGRALGASFDSALNAAYGRRRQLALAIFWRGLERLSKSLEIWLALWIMGHPISLFEAIVLESLTQAVRAAAFFVPAGLGVQEGALVLFGSVFGLSPELSLALSLSKRFRELIVGLPGLLAWQAIERRRALRLRARKI